MLRFVAAVLAGLLVFGSAEANAQTPEEWIVLGAKIHGAFGAFIPVGIRIGRDALPKLNAKPGEVSVTYYDSDKSPCACIADGVMIAVGASPGQRTLTIAREKAPAGLLAVIVMRHRKSAAEVRYNVPEDVLDRVRKWNRRPDPMARYDDVMKAERLFEISN